MDNSSTDSKWEPRNGDGYSFILFWVFYAATTNVEYELTVTDTGSDRSRSYINPFGTPFESVTDTQVFATSP
ncbi:MAG: hypothetical protein QF921_13020 [Pseudomonadales bacterium]|nr:hypothetical protein [Pseudomonadales bacterium]MDP6827631.1 hypothetical protein [Pseudomonadales bacterium]MDP6972410.1 hypothetical protein [Pseudomonadales bacterium]